MILTVTVSADVPDTLCLFVTIYAPSLGDVNLDNSTADYGSQQFKDTGIQERNDYSNRRDK